MFPFHISSSSKVFSSFRSVCHRDLKLENILFLRRSLDSPIRVADFGLSKQSQDLTVGAQWSTYSHPKRGFFPKIPTVEICAKSQRKNFPKAPYPRCSNIVSKRLQWSSARATALGGALNTSRRGEVFFGTLQGL